jgi:hypothetical protein
MEEAVPATLDNHSIVDNASAHQTPLIRRGLARYPLHAHGELLDQVKRVFAALAEAQLYRGANPFRYTTGGTRARSPWNPLAFRLPGRGVF